MIIFIEGRRCHPAPVCYNDGLNFGRFDGSAVARVLPYRIVIEKDAFIETFRDAFWDVVCEIRREDERDGEPSEFTAMGYVGLEQAFDHPDALADAIETYLIGPGILGRYFPACERRAYVINSVDTVVIGDRVELRGREFR